ncbi:uncharacterized protein LOC114272641 [Camellia sinensis]|uniref:uncharacterized protein LOC114272641 n=1 Tax=Camellia sinensis TaxID=4442 RepID=UPI001035DB67|nr:uncharacterized protein LOC114272641 [Camellia sinensis]
MAQYGFIVMENCLFLMCKFRGVTLVIEYNDGFNFKDLVYKLCAKCSELVGNSLNISYSMARHSSCGLESEEDLEVMVGLALSCDIHRIDVFNDKDRVTVHCKRRADLGCLWSVHARVENYSKAFVIKQFDDVHTCGSSFHTIKHARMTLSMIGELISSDICNKALTSVSEVVCDFKDYYGTEVSYRRAWMGVEKAKGLVFGDYSSSFDDLRWYVDATNACNPGSVFYMEFDIDRRHKDCLLAAATKDGNQGLYPLCFAIVDGESYDSWHWFLSKLLGILSSERDIVFVTDRHGGLLKALAEVFPFSSHSFCLMHLKTNLKTYLSVKSRESKENLLTLFSRCAYAHTIELFNELFEEFKGRCGRSVERFLED